VPSRAVPNTGPSVSALCRLLPHGNRGETHAGAVPDDAQRFTAAPSHLTHRVRERVSEARVALHLDDLEAHADPIRVIRQIDVRVAQHLSFGGCELELVEQIFGGLPREGERDALAE